MDARIQVATVVIGLTIIILVAHSLRNAKLYPSYAVLWTALGALLMLLPLYADAVRWAASNVFGIVGANHLIYALLFSFLLIYAFYLTQKICRLTNQVERIIVGLAILENRLGSSNADATRSSSLGNI